MESNHKAQPGFCSDCGTVLPLPTSSSGVTCYTCEKKWDLSVFDGMSSTFPLIFNTVSSYEEDKKNDGEVDGPVIERKCSRCDNNQMSYATMQLRSADEGQTVFYTCTKCKHTESENS